MTKRCKNEPASVPEFEDELNAWLDGRISCYASMCGLFSDQKFLDWNERVAKSAEGHLIRLYNQHGIRPSAVMNVLAFSWMTFQRDQTFWSKKGVNWLRSKRQRAALSKKVAALIDVLSCIEGRYVVPLSEAKKVKDFLDQLPAPAAHRPKDYTIRWCAGTLADFFTEITGRPLYPQIGALLSCAFSPDFWNPARKGEAAKKSIKRRRQHRLIAPSEIAKLTRGKQKPTFIHFNGPILAHSLMLQREGVAALTSGEAANSFSEYMAELLSGKG